MSVPTRRETTDHVYQKKIFTFMYDMWESKDLLINLPKMTLN